MKVHNCGVVVSCGVCKNSYHPPSQIVVAAPPLCRLLVLYFKNNLVRVTRCAGRVVALGGDSPISLPYELVGTVSSTAGNGAQKRFARFPPTCYLVLFPPAVAGVFRFRPRRNLYPVLFPAVRSRLETGHSQLIPMARAGFLKSKVIFSALAYIRAAPNLVFPKSLKKHSS